MDPLYLYLSLAVVGALVGIVSAALGIGGGTLMVPAFIVVYPEMDLNTAKGSSLFAITFVCAFNAFQQNRGARKNPWSVVGAIAGGSLAGAYLGGWATTLMPERAVAWGFIALLGFAAIRTFALEPPPVRENQVRLRQGIAVLIGIATGIVSGATGTGGGAILVPFALWAGIVSNERVVGLSNTVMVGTCLAGTAAHFMAERTSDLPWTYGLVNVSFAPIIVIPALLVAPIGYWINERLTLRRRKLVMGTLLALITLRLLERALV